MARIEQASVDSYHTVLREPHRPPSRGGITSALHSHYLTIQGEIYSFASLGSRKWVHKSDAVSFDYEVAGRYKNIVKETLRTTDAKGRKVMRGDRRFKRTLRTAQSRLPVSRREALD